MFTFYFVFGLKGIISRKRKKKLESLESKPLQRIFVADGMLFNSEGAVII